VVVSAPIVDIRGLRYRYPGAQGEFVTLVGPNGSGKSTLARLLCGLAAGAEAGVALVAGHDLTTADGRLGARRDAGVLFQNPDNQIVGTTVEEDVAFGLENIATPPAEIAARVSEMLDAFGLAELRHREPHTLSGGQRQRVAMASVLAVPRRLLVLDEPTAMLDAAGRREVLAAVRRLSGEGMTVVYVTQEMDEVVPAGRVVALEAGAVAFSGSPAELFGDAALVTRLSLGLPPAAELGMALLGRGRQLGARLPLTTDELVAALAGSAS
jgi:energy-coupling factor transport system ATP-binding protein